MKKTLIFLVALISIFSLASCDIQISDPNITIDQVEKEDVDIIQIQNQLSDIIKKVDDRCVGIVALSGKYKAIGSGVIYKILDRKSNKPATSSTVEGVAYVITNEHVIKPKDKNTTYRVYIGEEYYFFADCIGSDAKNDLAILKFTVPLSDETIQYDDFEDIYSSTMDLPARGSYAVAIGCPLGLKNFNYPTFGMVGNVSLGSITHSAPINPGSSGGGLFNSSGRLIGINVSKKSHIEDENNPEHSYIPVSGIGRAIPIWTVKKVVSQIEEVNDDIVRPELGANYREINGNLYPEQAKFLPTGVNQAVLIKEVFDDTNASSLEGKDLEGKSYQGLLVNDVIVGVDDKTISKATELDYYLNNLNIGSELKLKVYRKIGDAWVVIAFKGKMKA